MKEKSPAENWGLLPFVSITSPQPSATAEHLLHIPTIPPIWPPGIGFSSLGNSATTASVVRISPATEGALQRGARHLGRVDHAHRDKITILAGRRVVTLVVLAFHHFVHHDGSFGACVVGRSDERALRGAHTILMPASCSALPPLFLAAVSRHERVQHRRPE